MAILNDDELLQRLANDNNYCKGSGRTKGAKNLPDKLRALIGINAHFDTANNVSKEFGVAPITAHMAKKSEGHPEAQAEIGIALGKAKDQALNILMESLQVVTPEKLQKLKVMNAISVADKAASIVDKLTPKNNGPTVANNIMIYAPEVQTESAYDVVEVN